MTIEKLISILNQRTGLNYTFVEYDNTYIIWVLYEEVNYGKQVLKETVHNNEVTSFKIKQVIEMLSR